MAAAASSKFFRLGACSSSSRSDFFNKIPDELVVCIISLLPFKEAVRTSVLSSRWKYLFASMSDIKLRFANSVENIAGFVNVVDNLFRLRKTTCLVDKFFVGRLLSIDLRPSQFERWMQQAVMCHGIRELRLSFVFTAVLPAALFTSKTLEVLAIDFSCYKDAEIFNFSGDGGGFQVPAKVSLPRLKFLGLFELNYADDSSLNRIVSNCPVLEELICYLWENDSNLTVSSTTLKRLAVKYSCSEGWSGSFNIVVNAPNVEIFRYSCFGAVTTQNIVVGGPALAKATYEYEHLYGDPTHYIPNATALLRSISSTQTLTICDSALKSIQESNIPLPLFGNMKRLVIENCRFGLGALPCFLARCESLQVLELRNVGEWIRNPDAWIPLQEPKGSCLMSRLKIITFLRFEPGKDQIGMVEYFLRHASALKSMEISLCEEIDDCFVEMIKAMPRVSEECEVFLTKEFT